MGFAFQLNEFIDLGKLLICASAVSYINRDSSHPPKRMTEDYNELISQSFMPSLSLSLTHTQTHTHTHTDTYIAQQVYRERFRVKIMLYFLFRRWNDLSQD